MKRESLSSKLNSQHPSRRDFLAATAGSVLAGVAIPRVHAVGSDAIQIGLVGCGG
ncbi:MAG: twin-arginine translocation signal domain-containing protein, partial [Verrucomicrobia bacterium]|nr:twin-arginine translocation signal domain-containing protein [Verrucomicrobiota bacterium]